ncbi:hypothetical protein SCHPADRAFT_942521 [Schizopora paradoxa]|uniref:Uncharacterized protein n=1 Tax=Schizopora paradoxa TaxID=27342 RepID=A0A0H2RN34_9AGAM|nr:hypothetical protein SCHPADRAFT_942521 [Schizopora paradoxa]
MAQPPAPQFHRERVPAKVFSPTLAQGYRSDIANAHNYETMAPIYFGPQGARLTDILLHGTNAIPGGSDEVMNTAPYGIIKFYFTWPGYPHCEQLVTYDMYTGGSRPTRAKLACAAASLFVRFMERCKMFNVLPGAEKWRLALDGLQAHNIYFMSLVNTHQDVWQVSCDVVI